MSISGLTTAQELAFISEMNSARNLLAYGVHVVRSAPFIETTRDPILTMASIGLEKLHKLTIGLLALDNIGSWPSKDEMRGRSHNLTEMHRFVMDELRLRVADSTAYVRGLFDDVESDPVLPALVDALDMYGRSGRFYYLDLLGERPQAWESPNDYWQRIEDAAMKDHRLSELMANALADLSDKARWDAFLQALNGRVAGSLEGLWTMVAVAGRNHLLGEAGGVFGFEVHPSAVGTQR